MKIAVWDTYVAREDGKVMHFDILVPDTLKDEEQVFQYGKKYLAGKPFKTGRLSSSECRFCHMEEAPEVIEKAIEKEEYAIIEMQNCD